MFDYQKITNKKMLFDYRRKFRSQTSDNMERWKSRGGKSPRREEKKKEDQRRERVRGKKMQREKVEKSLVFASGGSISRLAKAAGAEPPGQMRDEKLNAVLWCEAHFQAKMYKTHQCRTTFGS